jgi:phi13 family phage major tail protein
MAKIGLNNFRYGILTEAEDGTPSYDGAKKLRKAISCNVEVENNDATLYADDTVVESDKTFNKATVTAGIDDDDMEVLSDLLGHTYSEADGMVRKTDDIAPYVGFGRVITKVVDGKYKYKVEFLYKVKFGEPSQEDNTKGESVEFGTTEIEGTASALANGEWSKSKIFETKAEAITYLESLLTTVAG